MSEATLELAADLHGPPAEQMISIGGAIGLEAADIRLSDQDLVVAFLDD